MLGTVLASDAPVLIGSLVFVAVVALAVVSAVFLAWRGARRRLATLRRHTAVRSAVALWDLARPGLSGPAPSPTGGLAGALRGFGLAGSLSTARLRHDLWRRVGMAERTVRQAADAGGPLGDLPSLCRRLHDVAFDLDRLLAMGDGLAPGTPEVDGPRRQAADVTRAADHIRLAALAAAGAAATTRVDELTADADREVRSLAAGLARARAAFPPVA